MNKSVIGGIVAVLVIVLLLWFAWRSQRTLLDNLPPRTEVADEAAGLDAANALAKTKKGFYMQVLGTGSMSPYIPAAPAGRDPYATVCAYAVLVATAFADIKAGDFCMHYAKAGGAHAVMHVAAAKIGNGWKMAGIANKEYDGPLMTEDKFIATTVHVFWWKLP